MNARWHILGVGAIGGLFAARLADAGIDVTLLSRDAGATGCARLTLLTGGRSQPYDLPQSHLADSTPLHCVLITTKAWAARDAVAAIADRLNAHSRLLLMVNGMGIREQLLADYPGLWIGCATTTEGAWRERALQVHHAGKGQTLLGHPGQAAAPEWLQPWTQRLERCNWTDDIDGALWRKLAINCAINPLTAAYRVRNGALGNDPDLRRQCLQLVDEIAAVCTASGQEQLARELPQLVATVVSATAENRSSMLQDELAGRRNEIEFITGYLLRQAQTLGIKAPANEALYRRLLREQDD